MTSSENMQDAVEELHAELRGDKHFDFLEDRHIVCYDCGEIHHSGVWPVCLTCGNDLEEA